MKAPKVVHDVAGVLDRIEDIEGKGQGKAVMLAIMSKMGDDEEFEDLLARLTSYLKKISN